MKIWVEKIFHSLLILIMKNFGARYALLGDVLKNIFVIFGLLQPIYVSRY